MKRSELLAVLMCIRLASWNQEACGGLSQDKTDALSPNYQLLAVFLGGEVSCKFFYPCLQVVFVSNFKSYLRLLKSTRPSFPVKILSHSRCTLLHLSQLLKSFCPLLHQCSKRLRYRGVEVNEFMSIGHTAVSCYLHFEQLQLFIMTLIGCKSSLFCEK